MTIFRFFAHCSIFLCLALFAASQANAEPIPRADTSTAAFVGEFPAGPIDEALWVASWEEFQKIYGGLSEDSEASYQVWSYFQSGGKVAWIVRSSLPAREASLGNAEEHTGIYALELQAMGFSQLVIPKISLLSEPGRTKAIVEALAFAQKSQAFVLFDPLPEWKDLYHADRVDLIRFPIPIESYGSARYGAVYSTNLILVDPLQGGKPRVVGPAGAIAGLMAETDREAGPWKAPAGLNLPMHIAADLEFSIDDERTGILRKQVINALRNFPVYGPVVWGARTLQANMDPSGDSTLIPVQRLEQMIQKSLSAGLQWVAFEENGPALWSRMQRDISDFMNGLAQQGAFYEFFVACDATTTTAEDILHGRVNCRISWSPVRPAEFVSLELTLPVSVPQ